MNSISKFVINRNNMEYLYTEKVLYVDGVHFFVYDSNNPTEYYPDTFYDTFGTDSKLSVYRAISLIESDFVTHNVESENINSLLDSLNLLKNRISRKDFRNPSLGQDKMNVVNAILLYNRLLNKKDDYVDEYDYENDLVILNKHFGLNEEVKLEEKVEIVNDLELSKSNNNFINIKDARVRMFDSKQEIV